MSNDEITRPRCKGTCGDAECEDMENAWRAAVGMPLLPEQLSLFIMESEETPYIPIVVIESPYGGVNLENNKRYLRAAICDCLDRGEAPFASHGLYTDGKDDTDSPNRLRYIQAGFAFRKVSDYTVVYVDLGISPGMQMGIDDSHKKNIPVKYRSLCGWRKEDTLTK